MLFRSPVPPSRIYQPELPSWPGGIRYRQGSLPQLRLCHLLKALPWIVRRSPFSVAVTRLLGDHRLAHLPLLEAYQPLHMQRLRPSEVCVPSALQVEDVRGISIWRFVVFFKLWRSGCTRSTPVSRKRRGLPRLGPAAVPRPELDLCPPQSSAHRQHGATEHASDGPVKSRVAPRTVVTEMPRPGRSTRGRLEYASATSGSLQPPQCTGHRNARPEPTQEDSSILFRHSQW